MARFSDGLRDCGFACGAARYHEHLPGDGSDRIVVYLSLADGPVYPFVIDTGAPWTVVNPEVADSLHRGMEPLSILGDCPPRIYIRGHPCRGSLHKVGVQLRADSGVSLFLDSVTVFVPALDEVTVRLPNFLGMRTFLDFIRFAIDPAELVFYFGQP